LGDIMSNDTTVQETDVVVIGAGPGGYVAAFAAADKGMNVVLVDAGGQPGGVCLNCGCIPSKTLLASAHTLLMFKHAALMGIDVAASTANWPKIQARKDAIVAAFRKGVTGLIQSHKVKIIPGRAVVTAPGQIKIESEAGPSEIGAEKIILATGSDPIELPTVPFDGQNVISSKEALALEQIPQSMVIVGGGVIGCEMACVYAAVGTKVTIVEALSRLLPMEDEWVGRLIEREFRKLSIDSLISQKVTSVNKTASPAKVVLENGQTIEAEKILVCVGRRPAIDKETIEALNLKMDSSAIAVNEKLETSVHGVYAIGDVVGTTFLAHGATTEAEVAAVNATDGDQKMSDYNLIPRVIFTFPEVASIGKTEQTCTSEGLDVSVGKGFFKANGRSVAHNDTVGQIRVVRDNSMNKILGITVVGTMATEFAAFAETLISMDPHKLGQITFPHPTVTETLEDAVKNAFGPNLYNSPKA